MSHTNTSTHTQEAVDESVATQLRDLDRQGGDMARFAHWAAAMLLVAFSAGSLLSISNAAFLTFLARWNAGQVDIPDGISLVVNVLLVLAADVALLYAASVLRVLVAAGASRDERRVHTWAMVGASLLESSTYLYLAWQFDHPTTVFLWIIVIARALAAPLFAAYLSMARPLPVAPRDVAYQAALASGKGVVRDVATLAADPTAPLDRKVRIYTASALMTHADRVRFDDIIEAVSEDAPAQLTITPPDGSDNGPRGGGLPITIQGGTNDMSYVPPVPMVSGLTERNDDARWNVGLHTAQAGGTKAASTGGTSGGTKRARVSRIVRPRKRLSVSERNRLDHATAEEVRGKVAAGEKWTQTRIKNEYGVSATRARDIWHEVTTGAPRLRAVGMR